MSTMVKYRKNIRHTSWNDLRANHLTDVRSKARRQWREDAKKRGIL